MEHRESSAQQYEDLNLRRSPQNHDTSALKSEPEEDLPDNYLIDIAGLYEKATSKADKDSQNPQPPSTAATLEEPSTSRYPPTSLLSNIEAQPQGQTNKQSLLYPSGTQTAPSTNSVRTHNGLVRSAHPVSEPCNCTESSTAASHACIHGPSPDVTLSEHLAIFHFCLSANDRRAEYEKSSTDFPAPKALRPKGSEACKAATPTYATKNIATFHSCSSSSSGSNNPRASRSSDDETPPHDRERGIEGEDHSSTSTVGLYTRRPSDHHSFLQ